jgi:hypothetical protein
MALRVEMQCPAGLGVFYLVFDLPVADRLITDNAEVPRSVTGSDLPGSLARESTLLNPLAHVYLQHTFS